MGTETNEGRKHKAATGRNYRTGLGKAVGERCSLGGPRTRKSGQWTTWDAQIAEEA